MYWWIIFVHTFDYEFIKKILINPQVVKYLGLIPWITIGKSVFLAFMVAFYLKKKKRDNLFWFRKTLFLPYFYSAQFIVKYLLGIFSSHQYMLKPTVIVSITGLFSNYFSFIILGGGQHAIIIAQEDNAPAVSSSS